MKSRSGFLLLSVVALFALVSVDPGFMGVPLLPRTDYVLHNLTSPEAPPAHFIIPLLIVFCSGTLAWREREVGLDELVDATPSPEWVFFLGKFLGFVMVLALCVGFRMVAGLLAQVGRGYYDFELGRYLQVLFGIQLADYLLLALLALLVHVVVNHKQISHLMVVLTMVVIIAAHGNEIGHELLVYGSDPGWTFTEMRGFGPSLVPWLWFKFYWAAWALLLGVVATLLWVRGTEEHTMARLRLVRNRLTRSKTGVAVGAGGLILASGAFIFHNTSTLIEYTTASDGMERRAEYERRYGQYDGAPQPRLMAVNLNVEIYPERRAVDIRGTYRMVNSTPVPIDSFHLATEVAPRAVAFDRSVSLVIGDEELGHRTYALDEPLQPGDSLRLTFEMQIEQQGFRDRGVASAVAKNGTYFRNLDWLPAIGYQPNRELNNAGQRQANGLAPRRTIPSLDDIAARQEAFLLQVGEGGIADAGLISFEAVVGTDETQTAIAPGALQQTWIEGGRRYFRYSTDPPIGNEYALFSAEYDVYEGQWNDVSIQIFHHPTHTGNLIRMVRSVQASLGHYTEQFGPYPYDHIRIVEHPGLGMGMHAEATTIDHEEGFTLLNPREDSLIIDLPFYVVAHEVAHQWWGSQTRNARVEGAGLLVESLASYSAYQVVESTYGTEHLRRIMRQLRRAYQVPRTRAAAPLLWANDPFLTYRKGPFAMYALSRYVGEERVNGALRRMLETHRSGTPPLLSSLDLYRHLQAVTPDSLQYLLQDLFETNTYWDLETERAQAKQTEGGSWQVTLDVRARKVVVDSTGVETAVPMDDLVEIGVFASGGGDETLGAPLYIQMHRIRSGQQTVTVTVPTQPARAGIDPYHLLIDLAMGDNIEEVESFIRGDALHRGL